jgi:NAD(P)-dependent dehydrogenase (short-subunit alcohol dehydrogenase family)
MLPADPPAPAEMRSTPEPDKMACDPDLCLPNPRLAMSSSWLITGSNRGIGLELTRQLSERGEPVIAICRTASPELEALGVSIEAGVELTSEAHLAALAERLRGVSLAGAILNAGLLIADSLQNLDAAGLRRQFEVNALAPLLLARALLPNLLAGSKLALITSRMGSIDDNSSGGYYGYRMSKTALNMAGKSLAVDLRPKGIAVAILHPGMVATRMVNFAGIPPEQAARGLLARIDALSLETSGRFWHANGEELPW